MQKLPHETDIRVGANLRRIRNLRNISQERLGEALGITFQQVQKYEKGMNRVSASKLVEAARFLEVSIEEMFAGVDVAGARAIEAPALSRQALHIARSCMRLPPQQTAAIIRLLDAIAPVETLEEAA